MQSISTNHQRRYLHSRMLDFCSKQRQGGHVEGITQKKKLLAGVDSQHGYKVYRKPTHTDTYLHYNSFPLPRIKNSVVRHSITERKQFVRWTTLKESLNIREVF